ncbi:hypothetical protein B0H10DRAFT_2167131 [Mycena sp. CBHHK59/15]|nr:hypothetical protein B0H10DRAFT_2167131 [Mycena sp. CBHHK59/15]
MIDVSALHGQISMTYSEKYVGFWLAFTLPTVVFLPCPIILIIGRKCYICSPPTRSILTMFVQCRLKACLVFAVWLTSNQLNNNLTLQVATMTTNSLPNNILLNLDPFSLILFIPLCDFVFYPALQHWGIKFTSLKRIMVPAIVWKAVLQFNIYQTSPCGHHPAHTRLTQPINVWVQAPVYLLIVLSKILTSITGLEHTFMKVPVNMCSRWLSVDPMLVWNYTMMAVLAGVGRGVFWLSVCWLDAEEDVLNSLHVGKDTDTHSDTDSFTAVGD